MIILCYFKKTTLRKDNIGNRLFNAELTFLLAIIWSEVVNNNNNNPLLFQKQPYAKRI